MFAVIIYLIIHLIIGVALSYFILSPNDFESGDWLLFSVLWPIGIPIISLMWTEVKPRKHFANAKRRSAAKKEAKRRKVEIEAKQDAELAQRLEERTM